MNQTIFYFAYYICLFDVFGIVFPPKSLCKHQNSSRISSLTSTPCIQILLAESSDEIYDLPDFIYFHIHFFTLREDVPKKNHLDGWKGVLIFTLEKDADHYIQDAVPKFTIKRNERKGTA